MNFPHIFTFYFSISFLYGVNGEINAANLRKQHESLDLEVDRQEAEWLAPKESPKEFDNIIRQRRKTIDELLNNFRKNLKREQDSADDQRSIHLNNQKYSNHWREADDESVNNPLFDRNVQEFGDERNAISFGGVSSNSTEASTESNTENLGRINKMEETTRNSDVKNYRNNFEQEKKELLKNPDKNDTKQIKQNQDSSRRQGHLRRHSMQADYFNADLQDYDDEEDHFTTGAKPRNNYEDTPNFENLRWIKNNPYTCCLCEDCKPLNANARNYFLQHYMKSYVVKPTESEHLKGARENYDFKYPVGEQDIYKTIQLKSYQKIPDHDSHLLLDNAPIIDPYALCSNNLSHEANYKLSQLEQDRGENQETYTISKLEQDPGGKQKNYSWPWPNWGLQKRRSLQFNPMNEIKLKTSSRLMERGFGPSLPSYSLGENRREYMIDNILKRKELDFQKKSNEKYHDLAAVAGEAEPSELRNPESWNDFEISEVKPNVISNDWSHIRKKRISEKQWNKQHDEDKEKALSAHQRRKREKKEKNVSNSYMSNAFKISSYQQIPISNDFEAQQFVKNTNHRSKRSKRSIDAICPKRRNSLPDQHQVTKRDLSFLKDPYEDYNSFHDYKDANHGHYQDLIDNNLESLNKDVGRYKPQSGHDEDFDKNLNKREQNERLKQLDPNIKFNKWQDQNLNRKRDINKIKLNKTGYMDMDKYLSFKQPSNNYQNMKSELESKWKQNILRQKKFARIPQRQPKKKKGNANRNSKGASKVAMRNLIPQDRDSNKNEPKTAPFNMYNLNKFNKFHDYSSKKWPRNLYNHYPDLSRDNTTGLPSTDLLQETSSVTSNDKSTKISLELRNEILNCTAFSSLEEFLKSLPSNITQGLMRTPTTDGSEEIELDFTTLDIKEPPTENPAWSTTELPTTPDSYTDIGDTTDFESTKATETWEEVTIDYSDTTESPNSTIDTAEEDVETTVTPMPDSDNTSWDDAYTPQPLPSSPLGAGSDDVKLNITIKANVQGNSKDKHFNGNGTINVKPGLRDNRFGRPVQKRKRSQGPQTRPSINDYDEDLYTDLSSGKLSGNIVKAVFDEVQENPELRVLWPSLKHNQLSDREPLPYMYSIRDKDNEDQVQHSQELMAKTMDAINDIIDQQVRSRSCVALRPDLQKFYDLIVKSNQLQESRREKRGYSKEMHDTKVHGRTPNADEDRTKTVKKLLRQYEALSLQEQQEVKPLRTVLLSELSELESRRVDPVRQTRDMQEKRNLGRTHDNDEITNLLEKYYTPQFLKLQKASDLYRSITNEADDGMP